MSPQAQGHADATLRAIVEGVEAETGARFFPSLVQHLAGALAAQYAFVSELSEDRMRFRTLAVWGRGGFLPNFEIPLDGTPCEAVLNGQVAHYPERLQALFPADKALADWGVESYCGVPLLNSSGTVVGHFAILDDKPMPDGDLGISIMRIFAARARAEIERLRAETALHDSEERLTRVLESAMDVIVTIDEEERIVLFNTAAEKVFRCPAAEAMGRPFSRFLSERVRDTLASYLHAFAQRGESQRYTWVPEGLTALRADGEEFPIEGTISQVEVRGRNLYTVILRDINQRKRAEAELQKLRLTNVCLQEEIRAQHNFEEMVGSSPALMAVLEKVEQVAPTDSTVLIYGETGTGKELIARAIHNRSARKDRPLVKVDCSAISAGLVESELFGHVKGAFTGALERRIGRFELADGGTIFLDEIGELPHETQVKLLRVLQEQQFEPVGSNKTVRVDVRIITASNRNLEDAVQAGRFRSDLFYRLNVFPIEVPPLRERRTDIPQLVTFFLTRFSKKLGKQVNTASQETMHCLMKYPWPGNIRELQNIIERAVILSQSSALELERILVPASPAAGLVGEAESPAQQAPPPGQAPPPLPTLEEIERIHILAALERAGGVIEGEKGAARILNLHPNTLRSRMSRLGIRRARHAVS